MHARLVFTTGDPARSDEGVRYITEKAVPLVLGLPGCRGMSVLADREHGKGVVATFWETERDRANSEEVARPVRQEGMSTFGGTSTIENYEVPIFHRRVVAGPGAGVRMTFIEGDPADAELALDTVRSVVIPAVEPLPGFCSVLQFLDRDRGRGIVAVTFADAAALAASRGPAAAVRADASAKSASTVRGVDEYTLEFSQIDTG